jgi:hypothetical protein
MAGHAEKNHWFVSVEMPKKRRSSAHDAEAEAENEAARQDRLQWAQNQKDKG